MVAIFDALPTIDLLIYFAASGGLAQPENLAKTIRVWSIAKTLYNENGPLDLGECFNPAQWRSSYFPNGIPKQSIVQVLKESGIDLDEWIRDYRQRYPQAAESVLNIMETDAFAVSDRTLRNDFATLSKLGWLEVVGEGKQRKYQLMSVLPRSIALQVHREEVSTQQLIPNELTLIADPFLSPILGEQRFILDVENVMSSDLSRRLSTIVDHLKVLWQCDPVQPVRLIYKSARLFQEECGVIIYPVCIYYCQRAPYLFGFGQTPGTISSEQPNLTEWYDYRLDHILSLEPIGWTEVPSSWRPKAWSGNGVPPRFVDKTPQRVLNEVGAGLGFEIYRPLKTLLLRFDQYFYGNYIEGTEREKLFTVITWEQAARAWKNDRDVPGGISLDQLFEGRSKQQTDVFCVIDHRVGDNNVVMRMRAWGDNVEVLLPWSFRERMRNDLTKSRSFYGELK